MTTSSASLAAWFWMTAGGICASLCAAPQVLGQTTIAQTAPGTGSAPAPNQDTEIALALSACPSAVAKDAAVYVLGKSGYVKVRDSHNGFTAIVQHSVPGAQEPQCLDAEGSRSLLHRILMVAELRAKGKNRDEIRSLVADAIAKGVLKPPTRPGVDYMLSTQTLTPNFKGEVIRFPPHVMFLAPYLANTDIGTDNSKLSSDGNPEGPAFVVLEGTPYAMIIVPVGSHGAMKHSMPGFDSGNEP